MKLQPPKAKKIPHKILQHGVKRVDSYAWLRDANWQELVQGKMNFADPDVKKYIEDENAYREHCLESTKSLEDKLYSEILGRIMEDDQTCPVPKGEYFYYTKTQKGLNYKIYCRKKTSLDASEEVYFDANNEAKDYDLFMLKGLKVNESNNLLAYAYNTTGSMDATIKIRDLRLNQDFDGQIENTTGSYVWINDTEIYFIERDESSRGKKIYKINVEKGLSKKTLVFTKPEECSNMFMSLSLSSDKKYVFVYLQSGSSLQVFYHKLSEDNFLLFAKGVDEISYDVDHWNDSFFILTNLDQKQNFQIYSCSDSDVNIASWSLIIPERESMFLDGFSIYAGKLVIEAKDTLMALPQILVFDLNTKKENTVKFSDEVYSLSLFGAYDHNSSVLRISYESPVTSSQDIDLDIVNMSQKILKTQNVPTYDSEKYQVERAFASAHDGERIPLTIITSKNFVKDGKAPSFVYAYGSYGLSYPSHFNQTIFSLVDRGFSITIAHIRGGSDRGKSWYLNGKLKNKLNTFKDFISSCEYLIDAKYTSKGLITANGGSAGGLLMGVVANMRPELFKAIVAEVAFVDMINTISDPSLPLTPPEWEEWGNPIQNKDDFEYMMQYSPYDNVRAQNYPHMLFTSGISDEQVTYWEPTKMVAKLREFKTDSNHLFLKMKMNAGHAGASKRYEWIRDKSFIYTFIISCYESGLTATSQA